MKLAANISLLYAEVGFLKRFAAARRDGFRAVEIQFPYTNSIEDIQRALSDNQQQCVLINVPAGDLMDGGEGLASSPGKVAEYAAALVECLSYARALKVSCVNVLPGRCFDENKRHEYLQTFKKNLIKTADALAPFGITTTFEAINTLDMPNFLISNAKDMFDIVRDLAHPAIKGQLDLYHMAMMGADVPQLLQILQKHSQDIGHIQFADMPGRGEPGSGQLDFEQIFEAITISRYNGWLGAEYRPGQATTRTLSWKKKLETQEATQS